MDDLKEQLINLVKLLPLYGAADRESASSYLALEGSQSLELETEPATKDASMSKAEPLSAKVREPGSIGRGDNCTASPG